MLSLFLVLAVAQIVEVTSTTTIGDMRISIASQLILNSPEGYGLYLKTLTKVVLPNTVSSVFSIRHQLVQ